LCETGLAVAAAAGDDDDDDDNVYTEVVINPDDYDLLHN